MAVTVNSDKVQESLDKQKLEKFKVKQEMLDKQKPKKKSKGKFNKKNPGQKKVTYTDSNNESVGETWRPFAAFFKDKNEQK